MHVYKISTIRARLFIWQECERFCYAVHFISSHVACRFLWKIHICVRFFLWILFGHLFYFNSAFVLSLNITMCLPASVSILWLDWTWKLTYMMCWCGWCEHWLVFKSITHLFRWKMVQRYPSMEWKLNTYTHTHNWTF